MKPMAIYLAEKLEDLPSTGDWLLINNAAAELRGLQADFERLNTTPPAQPAAVQQDGSKCVTPSKCREKFCVAPCPGCARAPRPAPVQPVGYTDGNGRAWAVKWSGALPPNLTLFTAPPAQPAPVQPVACQVCGGSGFIECDALQSRKKNDGKWGRCLNCQPYTTPPAAQPAPVPMADEDVEILEAVRRELEDKVYSKNAPGHAHHTPGIWDKDNGDLAGKPCAWCLTWKKFTKLIERESAAAPEKGGTA